MGILAVIGWIVLGVLYIIYKIGEEELNLGKAGGIGCVFFAVLFLTLAATAASISEELGGIFVAVCIFSVPVWAILYERRERKQSEERQKERSEISAIRSELPMPNRYQMERFIDEIRFIDDPSKQQLEYREMLSRAEANMPVTPLSVSHFKDMQAAWVYYSKNDTRSQERKRIFGEQDLSSKTYFDPTLYRSEEGKTERH